MRSKDRMLASVIIVAASGFVYRAQEGNVGEYLKYLIGSGMGFVIFP